ncbi:synaptotagmin-like protein 2 isoform 2-T2 [Dugong dugon]
MKTTDDSVSKVLDWFNRSSHSDGSNSSLKHPRGIEPKEKTDLKSQTAVVLVTDDTSLKENGSKALSSTQVELKPVGSDSTFQVEGDLLPAGNYQDDDMNIKLKSMNLSQQGTPKEGLGILQPFESYGTSQGSKNVDHSLRSKSTGEGTRIPPPASNYSYSALKGSNTEDQVPCHMTDVGILNEEESKFCVHGKNRGKSEVNFNSSAVVKEPSLKDDMKAERRSKRGNNILKASIEAENIRLPPGAAKGESPWKKPEVELQEANELPKNQVQREKYKRVTDRISFWEGKQVAAELTYKKPSSSCSQGKPAKACQPVKSLGGLTNNLSTGQNEYNQVTAKQVVLDEDDQASCLSSFYSSNKPKETRLPKSGTSNINEPIKKLPVADSLHSGRDITSLALQHPLNDGDEIHTPLENNASLIGESKLNFKVLPLKERIDEDDTEQVYNHSQFENLRKFWNLGADSNNESNVEKKSTTISHKNSVPFNSQKHKESNDIKSSRKNSHDTGVLLSHEKVTTREEMETLNSKCIPQVLPDETTLPWRPPRTSIHQLPGNESSKENMEKNTEWFVTLVVKKEKHDSDQEVEESLVKTSVLYKDYKDTFSDSLQKLLAEASSPAIQTSGGKVHVKQEPEPGCSESRAWPQETDLADAEEEAKQPKEIISDHIDKTVVLPKVERNTFTASLDKLLKEASEIPLSSLQTKLEPVTTRTNSEPEESRFFEKVVKQSHNASEEREIVAPFPEEEESSGNAAVPQKVQSGSEEETSPVLKTMERSDARKMTSKSLEDVSSDSSNQAKVDNLPEELVRSAEDVSTVPSQPGNQFSHPDKLKRMSKSVPAFLQDESDDRETDTASESSYQLSRHKKSPSSLTNLSSSSGMTSLSSVSGSMMSVYSGDFGNLEVKGNIQFAIDYVDSLKELHVFVAQCKDLAAADVKKQRSDPYVKTYLLPDKGKMGKKKTVVVKKTLNPVYNEILRYKIEKQILKTQKLNISVWHRDTFKRNSFLGEVELDLETWDWDNKQNKQLKWYPLKRKTAPVAIEAENRGEMKLALQYVPEPSPGKKLPTTGEVHIWVKECVDLPLLRGNHLNSFVKCTILPDTSRKSRQRTRAVGKTTNPVFNHTMVYDGFRPEDLTEACVELTVWDHYKLTNQFLGGLRIGFGTGKSYGTEVDWMDSTSEEVALWKKMVDSPNTWIEATLPLRTLLIARISK